MLAHWPRQKAVLCWPSTPWFLPNGWICWEVQYWPVLFRLQGPGSKGRLPCHHSLCRMSASASAPSALGGNAVPVVPVFINWNCSVSWNSLFSVFMCDTDHSFRSLNSVVLLYLCSSISCCCQTHYPRPRGPADAADMSVLPQWLWVLIQAVVLALLIKQDYETGGCGYTPVCRINVYI